tara:strand:- start:294 stop:638 length:345 start_codon:yes stop_codon:yes gene_type:complete
MPSLTLYIDKYIDHNLNQQTLRTIEENIVQIIVKEFDANQDNCQICWVNSEMFTSNYKILGEMKFRQKKSRGKNKKENCLKKIGNILKNNFKVSIRLRAFSIENASLTALDIKN